MLFLATGTIYSCWLFFERIDLFLDFSNKSDLELFFRSLLLPSRHLSIDLYHYVNMVSLIKSYLS